MKTHVLLFSACALFICTPDARADQFSVLGTASTYAVLAGSGITNAGSTVINGDLGLYPGTSVTSLVPTDVNGGYHVADATAQTAQADALSAYTYLGGLTVTQELTGTDLNGLILGPGVYFFTTTAALTGVLTLDFQNMNDANIVFLIGSGFGTSAGSSVSVINQGLNDNVYYRVGSAATLGANSTLYGDILSTAGISFGSGASIPCGSAIALTGAVTFISNSVTNCSATGSNVTRFASNPTPAATPEPSSLILLATGVTGAAGLLRRKRSA